MDGTLYLGNDLFPYTHKFLDKVEDTGRNYYFFTNNSSKDLEAYTTKLGKMGIDITPEQMMVSTDVILQYLDEHHPGAKLYVLVRLLCCVLLRKPDGHWMMKIRMSLSSALIRP